jgi:hypothetical protein
MGRAAARMRPGPMAAYNAAIIDIAWEIMVVLPIYIEKSKRLDSECFLLTRTYSIEPQGMSG